MAIDHCILTHALALVVILLSFVFSLVLARSPTFIPVDGDVSLLRLHVRHDGVLLPAHRHRRVLLLPVVHQHHLLLHQGKQSVSSARGRATVRVMCLRTEKLSTLRPPKNHEYMPRSHTASRARPAAKSYMVVLLLYVVQLFGSKGRIIVPDP